ncbi:MAG: Ig-like domain-containing protein [candidate division Zixibacteria bacterium]
MRFLIIVGLVLACDTKQPTDPDEAANLPPQCVITFPGDGDTVLIGDIDITVEASDSDGTIESVEFYTNNDLKFTDTELPYNYVDTTFWHESGEFNVKAVARDNDNNETEAELAVNLALFLPVNPFPDTIYVPENYPTIQDAIYASNIGDVIVVADGSYEENVIISHSLSLIGNGENTIIDDHIMRVESDSVIVKNLKVDKYNGYESSSPGPPGLIIYNSTFVLIDNVIANGGPFNVWFSPEYPDYPICTGGGPGARITNSSNIIIQNSDFSGNIGSDYYCWMGAPGGSGADIGSSINLFFFSTHLTGLDGGDGIHAWDHTYIGIRNCTITGNINNDATSTIIFP